MIQIQISQRSDGMDIATCGDAWAASRNGAEMKLARMLVSSGHTGAWQTVGEDGQVRLRGGSIEKLAEMTVLEGEGKPRFGKFTPRTDGFDE